VADVDTDLERRLRSLDALGTTDEAPAVRTLERRVHHRRRRRIGGGVLVVLTLVVGTGGAARLLSDDSPDEPQSLAVGDDSGADTSSVRRVTLLDGTAYELHAPPAADIGSLQVELAGALTWTPSDTDLTQVTDPPRARSVYAHPLSFEDLTDAEPDRTLRTGGGQTVHVFEQAPETAVLGASLQHRLYVIDFESWVVLVPDHAALADPGPTSSDAPLTVLDEQALFGGLDGTVRDSGLRLEPSDAVSLSETDSPDATFGDGTISLIRRPCAPEADGQRTDAGTTRCFVHGSVEASVGARDDDGRLAAELEVIAAPDQEVVPVVLQTWAVGGSQVGQATSLPAPGTGVLVHGTAELDALWDEWGLPGEPGPVRDVAEPTAVAFVTEDSPCLHQLDLLAIGYGEHGEVLTPLWGPSYRVACRLPSVPAAYVATFDPATLPDGIDVLQITAPRDDGEDPLLGSVTIRP
jgi:hypothetical protein